MADTRFTDVIEAEILHVLPADGRHEASRGCWCQPQLERRDPVTGTEVWVHNDHRQ